MSGCLHLRPRLMCLLPIVAKSEHSRDSSRAATSHPSSILPSQDTHLHQVGQVVLLQETPHLPELVVVLVYPVRT